jgi:glycosyltransferase involved in cell wall biosynthesis
MGMLSKRVSVVIPAYNCSEFISKALESVFHQTYADYEIVVVDDGSTDGTLEVLKSYGERIRLLRHEVNQNAASARNTAMANCHGELIAFLDGDDIWHPRKLEVFIETFDTHEDASYVFSDFNKFHDPVGKYEALSNSQTFPGLYDLFRNDFRSESGSFFIPRQKMFRLLLEGYPMFPSVAVVRRDLIDRIGSWSTDLRANEDFDLALRGARWSDFVYIDQCLSTVVRHASNTSRKTLQHQEGDIAVIDRHLEDTSYTADERRLLKYNRGRRLCQLGYGNWQSGNPRKARQMYLSALGHPGWFTHALIHWVGSFIRNP